MAPHCYNPSTRQWTAGVLIVWKGGMYEGGTGREHLAGRVVSVGLKAQDGSAFELVGAYMPVRSSDSATITEAWNIAEGLVLGAGHVVLAGDLNAELKAAIQRARRAGRERIETLAGCTANKEARPPG